MCPCRARSSGIKWMHVASAASLTGAGARQHIGQHRQKRLQKAHHPDGPPRRCCALSPTPCTPCHSTPPRSVLTAAERSHAAGVRQRHVARSRSGRRRTSGALYGTSAPAVDRLAYCGTNAGGIDSSGCSGAASITRRSGAEVLRGMPPNCARHRHLHGCAPGTAQLSAICGHTGPSFERAGVFPGGRRT